MTVASASDRLADIEAKLDLLVEQVDSLATDRGAAAAGGGTRPAEPSSFAAEVVASMGTKLATTDGDRVALRRLLERFIESAGTLEAGLIQLESARELFEDAAPLATGAVGAAAARLDDLEKRGYFRFAREGIGVLDRVVAGYDEDDIRALGANIVLILDTIKEMTQPEVMIMLRRTVQSMEQADVASVSLFSLLRRLRDPEVRRGLARLIEILRAMGGAPVTETTGSSFPVTKERR